MSRIPGLIATICLVAFGLVACGTASDGGANASARGSGDGLWEQLDRSRRDKENRVAATNARRDRLEGQLQRGRDRVPAEQRDRMEVWWKQFLDEDPAWLSSRRTWSGLGVVPQQILVENLLIAAVRGFETNQGRLYQRARAELFDLADPAIPYLISGLAGDHGDDVVKTRCVEILSDIGRPALPAVSRAWEDARDDKARLNLLRAVAAMGEHAEGRSTEFLGGVATRASWDFRLRLTAIEGLGAARDESAIRPLATCLEDDDLSVRKFAAAAIGNYSSPAVLGALVAALERSNARRLEEPREIEVIANCMTSLRRLTGRRYKTPAEWASWWRNR
ncbi:MAG: HEAT repeat domain-containing protein [Planctomycetota bacterium]